ncbi:MAG: poly(R)-hydroxyalkanoic acid synthase subunit PhaE, partial [Cyanobacteria bacterium P01_D01_bin.116]
SNQDNIQIRGKFLNATMAYKLYLQKLMEVFLKIVDQPVRSEVDEIHHRIYELSKDIKTLKKALTEFPEIRD